MNLTISKRALKICESLDAKQYRQVVSSILNLTANPEPHDSQPLRGAKRGERRIDAGEYRVIYAVADSLVDILVVGKRNDDEVYKIWERMQ